jgi:hypothetical protein
MSGFLNITEPRHAALLMTVLNAYCQAHGIARECPERVEIARKLVKLFDGGARTPEALRQGLAVSCEPRGAALAAERSSSLRWRP